ncbi:hypothetical protein NKDENANG_01017 [Candidatus Entotheonellaceae bacterium PAL068K]
MRSSRQRDIFITHDLGVIAEVCDEVMVMYAGMVAEKASVYELFQSPTHPYSQGLLSAIPRLDLPPKQKLQTIAGVVPDLVALPLIVCDEPVSALDVSIQSQILNLLLELQERLGLTYIFIAHNLSVVRHIADRIIVMYLGNVVEIIEAEAIVDTPMHPYTQALGSAIPIADPTVRKKK